MNRLKIIYNNYKGMPAESEINASILKRYVVKDKMYGCDFYVKPNGMIVEKKNLTKGELLHESQIIDLFVKGYL